MMDYYLIGVITFLAVISPGPDFAIVAKHAIAHDRKNALMASMGIGIGILIHSSYCVLGLAVVISQSLLLFSLIKYLGAAYLIYLGIKNLLSRPSSEQAELLQEKNIPAHWQAFRDGLLTNLLNPKCTLFILSVFTLIVRPHTNPFKQASFGIEIALISVLWFAFLSYGLTLERVKAKIEKMQHRINKVMGAVLISLGIVVILRPY